MYVEREIPIMEGINIQKRFKYPVKKKMIIGREQHESCNNPVLSPTLGSTYILIIFYDKIKSGPYMINVLYIMSTLLT